MPTVVVNGTSVFYEECTENYEKALATNGKIDAIAGELKEYLKKYDSILEKSASSLSPDSSLYAGIMASVSQIGSKAGSIEGSFSAMKAENLVEARKIDAQITEQNKRNAITGILRANSYEK